MFTLNNINQIFQEFVKAHINLGNNSPSYGKHYYFGVAGDHEAKPGGVRYPMVINELQNSGVSVKQDTYVLKIWVLTQHKLYEGRDVEALSDTKQIALDIIAYLRQTKFEANKTFTIDENIVLTDFHQSFNDGCCGWYFTITCKQFLDLDLCGIPLNGSVPQPINNGVVKIFDQHGNLLYTLYPGQMLVVNDLTTVTEDYTVTGTTQTTTQTPLVVYGVYINGQQTSDYTLVGNTFTFPSALDSDKVSITYAY